MHVDSLLTMANAVSVASGFNAGSVYNLGASIDLGSTTPGDIGMGEDCYLFVTVATAIGSASGAATIRIKLASDAAAIGSGFTASSASKHAASGAIAVTTTAADLPAGTLLWKVRLPMQSEVTPYERHLGLIVEVLGNNLNAGAITAKVVRGVPDNKVPYPDGRPTQA